MAYVNHQMGPPSDDMVTVKHGKHKIDQAALHNMAYYLINTVKYFFISIL